MPDHKTKHLHECVQTREDRKWSEEEETLNVGGCYGGF